MGKLENPQDHDGLLMRSGELLESPTRADRMDSGEEAENDASPRLRRLDALPQRQILNCSFDELVATSWDRAWRPVP